jgi:hypothetical protein
MNQADIFATVFLAALCDSTSVPSNVQMDECTHGRIFIDCSSLFHLTMLKRFGIVDSMNKLSTQRRAQIVGALVEGNSVRSTCRMTGAALHTVLRLLNDIGCVCAEYHDNYVRNVRVRRRRTFRILVARSDAQSGRSHSLVAFRKQ